MRQPYRRMPRRAASCAHHGHPRTRELTWASGLLTWHGGGTRRGSLDIPCDLLDIVCNSCMEEDPMIDTRSVGEELQAQLVQAARRGRDQARKAQEQVRKGQEQARKGQEAVTEIVKSLTSTAEA